MATIVLAAVGFVVWWSFKISPAGEVLLFDSEAWWLRPWTLITYPFMEWDFIRLVLGCLMAFFFMGALERAWGRKRFIPAYAVLLMFPPLALWIGAMASGVEQAAWGLWLMTGCWTAAYGTYRPQSVILIFGILPLKAMWIGWFAALAIVFYYGMGSPIAGLCAGLAPLAAWALASRRVEIGVLNPKKPSFRDEFGKSLKTKRDSEMERLRLRELLERSVQEEDEPKG